MKKNVMSGIVAVASLAGTAGSILAQTPVAAGTSAQRYEVRYLVERFALDGTLIDQGTTSQFFAGVANPVGGPDLVKIGGGSFASNVSVGRVDITIQARVGIIAGTHNQTNLGLSRLGGAGSLTSGYRIAFTDVVSRNLTLSQGTVTRGLTGSGLASGGVATTGLYTPFRGTLPSFSMASQGDNANAANGSTGLTATGSPIAFNATGGRTVNFGVPAEDYGVNDDNFNGSGPIAGAGTLNAEGTSFVGPESEFANYYKLTYVPREDLTPAGFRQINVAVSAQSARYIFAYNGGGQASNGATALIGDQSFTFFVPTPGAAAVLGLGGLAIARRRRA